MQYIGNLPRLQFKPVAYVYKCVRCLMVEKVEGK